MVEGKKYFIGKIYFLPSDGLEIVGFSTTSSWLQEKWEFCSSLLVPKMLIPSNVLNSSSNRHFDLEKMEFSVRISAISLINFKKTHQEKSCGGNLQFWLLIFPPEALISVGCSTTYSRILKVGEFLRGRQENVFQFCDETSGCGWATMLGDKSCNPKIFDVWDSSRRGSRHSLGAKKL